MFVQTKGRFLDISFHMTEDMKHRVMHAQLKVGDADLMFSVTFARMPYQPGNTIQIAIHHEEEAIVGEIFSALEDGGQVVIPLHKTDFSPLYGMGKDKFGVHFNVNVPGEQPQSYNSPSLINKASCSRIDRRPTLYPTMVVFNE